MNGDEEVIRLRTRLQQVDQLREQVKAMEHLLRYLEGYSRDAEVRLSPLGRISAWWKAGHRGSQPEMIREYTLSSHEKRALRDWLMEHARELAERSDRMERDLAHKGEEQ